MRAAIKKGLKRVRPLVDSTDRRYNIETRTLVYCQTRGLVAASRRNTGKV